MARRVCTWLTVFVFFFTVVGAPLFADDTVVPDILPGESRVEEVLDDTLEDAWEDIKETPETVADQVPLATDETGRWLVRTTVKSGSSFASAPNYQVLRNGQHYATDFTKHGTVRSAFTHAMQPQAIGTAVKGSVKATTHPLALAGQVAAPIALEGYRQLREDGSLDARKLGEAVEPAPIIGSTLGVIGGDAAGAAVQAGLGAVGGPAGRVAGLFARPLMAWGGYYLGRNAGRSVQDGKPSARTALADTMREINPTQFVCSVAGATVGGMVGQALIPIPVVGYIAGYAIGGVIGNAIGNIIGKHGLTGAINKRLISWLHRKADDLEGTNKRQRREAVDVESDGSIVTVPASQVQSQDKPLPAMRLLAEAAQ